MFRRKFMARSRAIKPENTRRKRNNPLPSAGITFITAKRPRRPRWPATERLPLRAGHALGLYRGGGCRLITQSAFRFFMGSNLLLFFILTGVPAVFAASGGARLNACNEDRKQDNVKGLHTMLLLRP